MNSNRLVFASLVCVLTALPISTAGAAYAGPLSRYLTVGKVRIQKVDEYQVQSREALALALNLPLESASEPDAGASGDVTGAVNTADMILDKIINMGKKIWAIVEANKPVVQTQFDANASALPDGASSWLNLQGWQTPTVKVYKITYENLYGAAVVDFSFRVVYTAGGNVKGKGLYLTNVAVVPADISVSWLYTFNANASIPSIVNTGSQDNPVAGMQVNVDWTVSTVLKHEQSTSSFFLKGDGSFMDLSNGT